LTAVGNTASNCRSLPGRMVNCAISTIMPTLRA
jgi:hypothetical protein